ncbi:MAG: TonB-dependent receptor [Acidobacteriota bacterium]|nr:TonB-dependent receptor [Acidobacteriota bacterium]MDE3263929.1 TonB-dependent receptor [Acidobacteriota bacterium]
MTRFSLSRTLLILALAGLSYGVAVPTAAQEPGGDEARTTPGQAFSEEITVTARKREENLQEVPFSVVAPSEDVLRSRGAGNLEEIAANVAGFTVQNLGPGQSQVAMRGVAAGQIVRDQPGVKEQVGIYLDESVISLSLFTPDIDLFDMSRVEVLRGPQGTLFGSGSLAGTVRYITNQPELGVSDGFGELSVSSVGDGGLGGSAKVAVNVPVGDTSAMRLTAYHTSFGGFMDAVQPDLSVNEDVNSGERTGARWALRMEPSENVTVTPRLLYQEVEMDGWNRIDDFNILANPYTTTRPAVDLGERQLFTQFEEPTTDDFLLADLKVVVDLPDGYYFTSITSATDRDVLVVRDSTALYASVAGATIGLPEAVYTLDAPLIDATTATGLTQELRLASGDEYTHWVLGLFYGTSERAYGQSLPITGFQAMTGIPTAGAFGAAVDELFYSDLNYDFDQTAAFFEITWTAGERLDLTAGARWYDYEETRSQVFDGLFADPGPTQGETSANGVAPRFIASFEATENTQLNAQVSKGFRLGGINDPLNVPVCTPEDLATFSGRDSWEDEELWNVEIGSKSTIMGGRGTFNVAAFTMDISNLQTTVTAGSCSSRLVFNVPNARSTGLELELTAQPSAVFDFAISASYASSELGSTLTSTAADGTTSVVSGIEKGNRLPTVPRFQAAVAATWRWEAGDWAGYLSSAFQHVGSRFTQIGDHAPGFGTVDLLALSATNPVGGPLTQTTFRFDPEMPAYDLLNLRLGFLNERWDIALFVNNALDERALLALDQERGTRARVGYLTNQPRTIGLSSRINF